ncbi:MAG: GNAT family N-acetyltransferase [Candidatus Magasanikbacteria bacterium]|nr:GNAT family N-acetyltransferase [Candidatus Magasanikbacteria bacterium]
MEISEIKKNSFAVKFVARINGEVAGRAYLYIIKNDLHEKPYGLMEDVFVEEKYRGQRLGRSLVENLIKKAEELNCYKLIGQSRFDREHVHRLYENLGFKRHGYNFRLNF